MKSFFLWAITVVGLVTVLVGGIQLVNIGLKEWVFTKADSTACAYIQPMAFPVQIQSNSSTAVEQCKEQQAAQTQNTASQAVAELIVGLPIFLYFLKLARNS
ncbi:MAG: hypothetical protein ACYDBV_14435 [Nitrospiria bacterium]